MDKTDEEYAEEIQIAAKRLNTLTRDATLAGLKTEININNINRVGVAPLSIVEVEVSRVFAARKPLAEPEAENGNG